LYSSIEHSNVQRRFHPSLQWLGHFYYNVSVIFRFRQLFFGFPHLLQWLSKFFLSWLNHLLQCSIIFEILSTLSYFFKVRQILFEILSITFFISLSYLHDLLGHVHCIHKLHGEWNNLREERLLTMGICVWLDLPVLRGLSDHDYD
jgi:hypothetical protein